MAEDGGAEADAGGAFFDGDEEVVGHAHGELGEGGAGGEVFVAEAAEMLEVGAGGGWVGVEWGDGHESGGDESGEWSEGGEERGEGRGVADVETVLGVFGGQLDFDEDGEGFAQGKAGGVEPLRGLEGVEGVDALEELGGFGGLVVLQWTNEMGGASSRE